MSDQLPAGPELDAEIAVKVMVWHAGEYGYWWCDDSSLEGYGKCERELIKDWSPSTDIAAAWKVVERATEAELTNHTKRWICRLIFDHGGSGDDAEYGSASAETAPLAICRAALAAVGVG